jgi:sialidase-1
MPDVQGSLLRFSSRSDGDQRNRILFSAPAHPAAREVMTIRSSYDEALTWNTWDQGKVFYWGPTAYSDMVRLDGDQAALLYEARVATPYETIRTRGSTRPTSRRRTALPQASPARRRPVR